MNAYDWRDESERRDDEKGERGVKKSGRIGEEAESAQPPVDAHTACTSTKRRTLARTLTRNAMLIASSTRPKLHKGLDIPVFPSLSLSSARTAAKERPIPRTRRSG